MLGDKGFEPMNTVIISFHSIDFIHKFMKPINEKKTLVFL